MIYPVRTTIAKERFPAICGRITHRRFKNKDLEADYLREISKRDSVFSCYIDLWWDSARSEYINDETDCYTAYAKVLLLDWLNKITFANILRSRFPTAEKVTNIKDGTTPIDAIHIFEEITQKCDYMESNY